MQKEYKQEEKPIEDLMLLEPDAVYSYADYLRWTFEERVELIKGKLFKMSPAPGRRHQKVSFQMTLALGNFLKGEKCQVYHAPFDVRLPGARGSEKEIYTVVQPDLCVICDETKLDEKGCLGAPDLIVEILSPQSAAKDLKDKFHLYEESGVKEYWVVYPEEEVLELFRLNANGLYERISAFTSDDIIDSAVLPGIKLAVKDIFQDH